MVRNRQTSQRRSSSRFLLGLLCLALVILGSTLQVAHTHPGGDLTHSDCALCATAHVVAQTVASPAPITAVLIVASIHVAPSLPRPAKPSVFALFTRPPPAVSTFA